MAFDIVLGQNDSDKLSALMHNRPPRRLKVVNHCNVTVLLIEVAYHKSFTMLRGGEDISLQDVLRGRALNRAGTEFLFVCEN